ncbi:isocitrate lyase/PEP mutase family protein [Nocardia stercoris]|uniref:Isocitrate lyase/phosphoenolpyruvate mutase family protein n=1 Tax=Nocardia stercoris TaxID=2483361 RepID=A0A3M2L1T8_9NOCA|nr:isocitrate lyase/phosphoenolpyruvate mutase family protein [Nocardia stercoris]RMI30690.1 isocitrate lyase/phosphoenolpyruvate mutase family protein [Nocardia stercoris]
MTELQSKASTFLALHRPGDPVTLPTVWDAWSANIVAEKGFSALTVGSHPLADSVGKSDHEGMSFADVLVRVREITSAVEIPVSVDLESGYGVEPERLIDELLGAGAIGFNIEDTVHAEGGRLRAPEEHADLVARLRAAADESGVRVVINARTDVLLRPDPEPYVDEAIARLRLAADAGADVLYPVGRNPAEIQRRLCAELPLPVNAVTLPGQGNPAYFGELGVARISFGPFLQQAFAERAASLFDAWR